MSSSDPFRSRFEVFGRDPRHVVATINQTALEDLQHLLDLEEGGDGRVILLRAPRAGFGKTSLLQRVARRFETSHHFIRINLIGGRTTDASHVLEYVLQALCKVVPGSATLTHLDLLARKILALGLEPLVASGEVPCQDREGALKALQEQPAATFDFHHERAVTAHWTKSNFEILGPRLAAEVSQLSGASLREASYWVELLFRFATTAPDNVERARLLFETVFRADLQSQSESAAEERLHGLLALLGTVTRVVLIVDDTEGLSTHPPDALSLASFLTNISQACPGSLVLLSVNDDIWETAFLPRLPGGLADRLTEYQISLSPLTEEQARAIVQARAGEHADTILAKMEFGEGDLYARRILKEASDAWKAVAPRLPLGASAALAADEGSDESTDQSPASVDAEIDSDLDLDEDDLDLDDSPDAGGAAFGAAALGATSVGIAGAAAAGASASAAAGAKAVFAAGLQEVSTPPPLAEPAEAGSPPEEPGATDPQPPVEAEAEAAAGDKENAPDKEELKNPFFAKTIKPPLSTGARPEATGFWESVTDEESPAAAEAGTESPSAAAADPPSPFAPVKPGPPAFASPVETPDEEKTTEEPATGKEREEEPVSPFAPVGRKPDAEPVEEKKDDPSPFADVTSPPDLPDSSSDEPAAPFAAVGMKPPVDEQGTPDDDQEKHDAPHNPFAPVSEKPALEEKEDADEPAASSPFAPVGMKPSVGEPREAEATASPEAPPLAELEDTAKAAEEPAEDTASIFSKAIGESESESEVSDDVKEEESASPFAAFGDKPGPSSEEKAQDEPARQEGGGEKPELDSAFANPFGTAKSQESAGQETSEPAAPFAAIGDQPESTDQSGPADDQERDPKPTGGSPFAAGAPAPVAPTPAAEDSSIFAPIKPSGSGEIDFDKLRPLQDSGGSSPQTAEVGEAATKAGPPPLQPVSTDPAESPFASLGSAPPPLDPLTGGQFGASGLFGNGNGNETQEEAHPADDSTSGDSPFAKSPASSAPGAFQPVGTPPPAASPADEPPSSSSEEPAPSLPDSPFAAGMPPALEEAKAEPEAGSAAGGIDVPPAPPAEVSFVPLSKPSTPRGGGKPPQALDLPGSGFKIDPFEDSHAADSEAVAPSPFSKPAEAAPPASEAPSPFAKADSATPPASETSSPFAKPEAPSAPGFGGEAASPFSKPLESPSPASPDETPTPLSKPAAWSSPSDEPPSPFSKPAAPEPASSASEPPVDSPFKPIAPDPSGESQSADSPFAAAQPGPGVGPHPLNPGRIELPPKRTPDAPPAAPVTNPLSGTGTGSPFESSGPPASAFSVPPVHPAPPADSPPSQPPASPFAGPADPKPSASASPFAAPSSSSDSPPPAAGPPSLDIPPAAGSVTGEPDPKPPGLLGGSGMDEDKVDELLRQFKERYGRE